MTITLSELAQRLSAKLVLKGQDITPIVGIKTLQSAGPGEISFLANPKYKAQLPETKATAVILSEDMLADCPSHALIMKNPYLGFAKAAALFDRTPVPLPGTHPSAVIGQNCHIDASVAIGPNVVIGNRVKLGKNVVIGANCVLSDDVGIDDGSILKPNVSIYHEVKIGKACIIHSGTVIGSDGFGMANEGGRWLKIPQLGSVLIGDEVEIGANCSIDRGALDNTEIRSGAKIDNQVQVAHNVIIGEHTAIAAKVGIAGSTTIGKYCMIGGATGIGGHLSIADRVMITGMTMVTHSLHTPGVYSSGIPVKPQAVWHKNVARFQRLDKMAQQLKALEARIKDLQNLHKG